METPNVSPKSRLVALLLCWFFGVFGAHRFYAEKYGTALLMLLTFGGLGVWALIDMIFILLGSFRDNLGRPMYRWVEPGSF